MEEDGVLVRYPIALILIFLAGYVGMTLKKDLKPVHYSGGGLVLNGESLRLVSGPFSTFLADLLWAGVVQKYGDKNFRKSASDEDWFELYRSIKAVSELDPDFFIPYYFAGVILPWESNLYYESIGLDKKGMIYLPDEWRLPFLVGFNLFYFAHKKKEAAYFLERASHLPESPSYLPRLVARLLYESGETKAALLFLKGMLQETHDPQIREQLKKRYNALLGVLVIEEAIQVFRQKYGRYPRSLDELVETRILREIPVDPYGGVYYWDAGEKRVKSTSNFHPGIEGKGVLNENLN